MKNSVSFRIAKDSGKFITKGEYLKPTPNSGIAELFRHSPDHNRQAYVQPANNPNTKALIIGGSEYTLQEMADALAIDLSQYKTSPNKKANDPLSQLASLSPKHFKTLSRDDVLAHFGIEEKKRRGLGSKMYPAFHYENKWLNNFNKQKRLKNEETKPRWMAEKGASLTGFFNVEKAIKEKAIYFVNGEWSLFALWGYYGIDGVCPKAGEGSGLSSDLSFAKGKRCVITYDDDNTGKKSSKQLAINLLESGAESVKIVFLNRSLNRQRKIDLEDFAQMGKSFDDLKKIIAETLPYDENNPFTSPEVDKLPVAKFAQYISNQFVVAEGSDFNEIYRREEDNPLYINHKSKEVLTRFIDKLLPDFPPEKQDKILKSLSRKADYFDSQKAFSQPIIHFKNGVVDLKTGKFRQPKEGELVINPIHEYDNKLGKPEIFLKALREWFPEADEYGIEYLLKAIAYLTLTPHKKYQVWFNFYGSGANGKSTLTKIISELVGASNTADVDLASWNRFTTASFLGKKLIIGRDSGSYLENSSPLKIITGDDMIGVEPKGKDAYSVHNNWKVIVSSNTPLQSRDKSHGFVRRLSVIPFTQKFEIDPAFEATLLAPEEISKVVNLLIKHAIELEHTNGKILKNPPQFIANAIADFQSQNDPVYEWIGDNAGELFKDTDFVGMKVLTYSLKEWMEKNSSPLRGIRKYQGKDGIIDKTLQMYFEKKGYKSYYTSDSGNNRGIKCDLNIPIENKAPVPPVPPKVVTGEVIPLRSNPPASSGSSENLSDKENEVILFNNPNKNNDQAIASNSINPVPNTFPEEPEKYIQTSGGLNSILNTLPEEPEEPEDINPTGNKKATNRDGNYTEDLISEEEKEVEKEMVEFYRGTK